jgi:colicin import membrane protein
VSFDTYIRPDHYCFVQERVFLDHSIPRYAVPRSHNVTIINNTQNITNITVVQDRVVNRSLSLDHVERAVGRRVPRLRAVDQTSVKSTRQARVKGDAVEVFRPVVRPTNRTPARASIEARRPDAPQQKDARDHVARERVVEQEKQRAAEQREQEARRTLEKRREEEQQRVVVKQREENARREVEARRELEKQREATARREADARRELEKQREATARREDQPRREADARRAIEQRPAVQRPEAASRIGHEPEREQRASEAIQERDQRGATSAERQKEKDKEKAKPKQ